MSNNVIKLRASNSAYSEKVMEDCYMEADMGLGMFAQHFAKTRGDLIAYAIESDYLVWLPSFLNRRGWLDQDWRGRLSALSVDIEKI